MARRRRRVRSDRIKAAVAEPENRLRRQSADPVCRRRRRERVIGRDRPHALDTNHADQALGIAGPSLPQPDRSLLPLLFIQ